MLTKTPPIFPIFTTKEVGEGTGLGLSTVYGIVKQHNGYITVYSKPDQGTAFQVFLPLIKARNQEALTPAIAPIRSGNETILVAEDDEEVRHFISHILAQFGNRVIEAKDGLDAIRKFREHTGISLVILDSIMPRNNGREAYEVIK